MSLQLVFVKESSLCFIPDARHILRRQLAGLVTGLFRFLLADILLFLKFFLRQGMSLKESSQLSVATLQHRNDFHVGPVVHCNAPDLRNRDTHAPVLAAAFDTDQGAITDSCPFGTAGVTVDAIPVAWKGMQQALARRRKGLPIGLRIRFASVYFAAF